MSLKNKYRKTRLLNLIVMLSVCYFSSSNLHAEPGWYIGSSLGYSDFDSDNIDKDLANKFTPGTSSLRKKAIPFHLFFGYKHNQYLGFEGGFLYLDKREGHTILQSQPGIDTETVRDVDGFLFGIKGFYPLQEQYSLQLSGGYYLWHVETSITAPSGSGISINFDERKLRPYLAIALHRAMTQQTSLFAQWLKSDVDSQNTNVLSFGFMHYIKNKNL